MKTKIIMMSALLALVATGCTKDDNQKVNDGRIKIFAEGMTAAGGNTKLLVDPATVLSSNGHNGIEWKADETININGKPATISDNYEVDLDAAEIVGYNSSFYAIYPGPVFGTGNSWDVKNNKDNTSQITLTSLAVNFQDVGHDIMFPMATKVADDAQEMTFKHLTAGFMMTLSANSAAVELKQLKVYVYGVPGVGDAAGSATVDGMTCNVKWANEGPMIPIQEVGEVDDDEPAYGSEMVFNLYDHGTAGVTIDGDLTFCIPVTLTKVQRIAVVGYNDLGKVFTKTLNMKGNTVVLDRSKMYTVKAIEIN